MIRKFLFGLMAALIFIFAGPMQAQQPAAPIKPNPGQPAHARGHKDPLNKEARHAAMAQHHKMIHAVLRAAVNLPATYDCSNLCTPVKDQGQCGSCWDFSGTCVVESACIKASVLDNTAASQLSEQYTLDQCDGSNGGCSGDDNTTVLMDAKLAGLPLTSAYGAYTASSDRCQSAMPGKMYLLNDWGYVSGQSGIPAVDLIKAAMITYGPIGCGVSAGDEWDSYAGGNAVITAGGWDVNHDVVQVGWDDTKQAWLVRNSWGSGWGNGGYCWVAYTACQIGSEAVWAIAGPPIPPVPPTPPVPPVPPTPPTPPAPIVLGPVTITAGSYTCELKSGIFSRAINLGSPQLPNGQYTITFQVQAEAKRKESKQQVVPTPAKK